MSLLFYAEEQSTYREHYSLYFSGKDIVKYAKKISRHFKLKPQILQTTNKKGLANISFNYIKLPKNKCCLGLICHEVAHLVSYRDYGDSGHNKRMKRAVRRVMNWSKRYLPKEECQNKGVDKNGEHFEREENIFQRELVAV